MEKCKLCGRPSKLLDSHIIPKFVVKYLKDTSVTGYLREGEYPNLRKQDFAKIKLLCFGCEQLFSKQEKEFSENIFRKHHHEGITRFEYQEWLRHFVISMNWRIAVTEIDSFFTKHPILGKLVQNAIDEWTPYLLGEIKSPSQYQNDMFIFDILDVTTPQVGVDRLNWLLHRGVDATIVFSKKEVGIYWRIPGFLFFCHIKPNENKKWQGTRIHRNGIISSPQYIRDKHFGAFLLERLKNISKTIDSEISQRQWDKIAQAYRENYNSSKHFKIDQILNADMKL